MQADFDEALFHWSIWKMLFIGRQVLSLPKSRTELLDQMVSMRSQVTDYASYSRGDELQSCFSDKELQSAQVLEINTMDILFPRKSRGGKIQYPKMLPN